MLEKIRSRVTYANVMASIAVFLVLGSGAAVANHLSVRASDIERNAVRAKHIKSNAVKPRHVPPDSLTGDDIDESTLAVNGADPGNGSGGDNGPAGDTVYWAVVELNGQLARGSSGGVSSTRQANGRYSVNMGRSVANCSHVAALGRTAAFNNVNNQQIQQAPTPGEIGSAPQLGENQRLLVHTFNSNGNQADRPFHLMMVC